MTDALSNAERLLREACVRGDALGRTCDDWKANPEAVRCRFCAAADALAAERERPANFCRDCGADIRALRDVGGVHTCNDPLPPATGMCDCGDPIAASCASCIVADYQAQHPSCATCCPRPYCAAVDALEAAPQAPTPEPSEAMARVFESLPSRTTPHGTWRVCPTCSGDGKFVEFDKGCAARWAHPLLNAPSATRPARAGEPSEAMVEAAYDELQKWRNGTTRAVTAKTEKAEVRSVAYKMLRAALSAQEGA